MSNEVRTDFFAKLLMGGGSAVVGIACIAGGISAFDREKGAGAFLLLALGVGLGILFLRTAWKIFGE